MNIVGGLLGLGSAFVCFALLFVVLVIALVVWLWQRQPGQEVSVSAPTPPIQTTIEHPTAGSGSSPSAPAPTPVPPVEPAAPSAPPTPPAEPPAPPSADA